MPKIASEVAAKEITEWLDFKRVSEAKRETYKDNIETLTNAISDGLLKRSAEGNLLVQELKFEVGEEKKVTELTFKPRLMISDIHTAMKGEKSTDADARVLGYIAALTGQPKGIIRKLDTEDYAVGQAIALFFM